jgi:hypothetical protein
VTPRELLTTPDIRQARDLARLNSLRLGRPFTVVAQPTKPNTTYALVAAPASEVVDLGEAVASFVAGVAVDLGGGK